MKHQRILQDELSSCRCSTTSHGDVKTTRKNQIIENSKIGVSRHLDPSTPTQNGPNRGLVWKTQLFLLKGICTVIL